MFHSGFHGVDPFLNRLKLRSLITTEEERAVLALSGHVTEIPAHRDFVHISEHVEHSCLVVSGLVGRFGQNRDGSRQITCFHIPGDMPDLHSVISPKAAWGLTALTATTVMRIPHIDLYRLASMHFGIAEAFWRDCVADGSIFSEWVVNVGRRGASARLAHLFCEMAIRCERAGQGDRHSFPLPITQTDLADATGLTSVHVNRTLRNLRTRSIVTARAKTVLIHDWPQLVAIGDFDEGFLMMEGPYPRIAAAA
ncbi:MAG: Crp/Fnr family transcriptional regulator [Rhizobiaceae bacterium]|nr:MAG: Crp/Fnr family transcriptional regulator [Rhizobiaceae bacterium]